MTVSESAPVLARREETVCFSAQADVVGGIVVCALGVDALRHVRDRSEIAIAASNRSTNGLRNWLSNNAQAV